MTVKDYSGHHRARIHSYDSQSRTAEISIPSVTGDVQITATFMYPLSHDDRDTELQILPSADCFIFFEANDVQSPVICGYSSHGEGTETVQDIRRIRQKNIEILAENNILIEAGSVDVKGNTTFFNNVVIKGSFTVEGASDLKGTTKIEGTQWATHGHIGVQSGNSKTGVVG